MSRYRVRGWLLLLGLAVATGPIADAEANDEAPDAFDFALVGDYPYYPRDEANIPHLLDSLRTAKGLAWILHLGDLHNPKHTDCSEALYRTRRSWFTELGVPFVLTPGDNDWADCKGDRLAHLESLRRIYFADPSRADGPRGFSVRSQSEGDAFPELVENAIWERGGVVFATMHMIGHSRRSVFDGEHEAKQRLAQAGVAWLDEAFRLARERDARGVFLAMQVSLWPTTMNTWAAEVLWPDFIDQTPAFRDFKQGLIRHAREFERPIVLANGDTHTFRVDKPLHDSELEMIENFTRVEGFGSPYGHWVRVSVEPDRDEVFTFRQEWVRENMFTLVPHADREEEYESRRLGSLIYVVRIVQAIPTFLAFVGAFALARGGWRWVARWRARRT